MELNLSATEVRVLGALIEKSLTTPEYYPLTLGALCAACNQKSNRDPVITCPEKDVVRALDRLRERGIVWSVAMAGSRVPKYRHTAAESLQVPPLQEAVLAELMLRGAQTVAELRAHTERMVPVATVADIEQALQGLAGRTDGVLVHRVGRQSGQRGERWSHGLSGPPTETSASAEPPPEPARAEVAAENARLAALESQVATLNASIQDLQAQFAEFRKLVE